MNKQIKPGTVFKEQYLVIKKIDSGVASLIYLANDVKRKQKVILKLLDLNDSTISNKIKRFKLEVNTLAMMNNRNIVKIFDYIGPTNEYKNYIMVMEYIEGSNLKEIIRKRNKLSVKEAIDYTKQLLTGLHSIHQLDFVHRDIKPQNLLIDFKTNTLKIIDFGILLKSIDQNLTKEGNIIGSVQYMAPERVEGSIANSQSDIYAVGIVLYEMLAGTVPFKGDDPKQVLWKHVKDELINIQEYNIDVDKHLNNIIKKATTKDIRERYKTVDEFYRDLIRYENEFFHNKKNEKIKGSVTKEINSLVSESNKKNNSKLFWIIVSISILILIIVVVLLILLFV